MTIINISSAIESRIGKVSWKFWTQRRYVLVMMIHLAIANMYIMRINLSVAIVQMAKTNFDWNSKEQGLILASFFYGYIITQLPGGVLSRYFSAHRVFGISIGLCALLTLLTPILSFNFYMLVAVRIVEGILLGTTFPTIMSILYKWAPPLEKSRMIMICFTGTNSGTVVAMSASGILGEYLGWESIFYVSGFISIVWCITWACIIKETPETDPWISEAEKKYILGSIVTSNDAPTKIPWLKILTSVPVWGLIVVLTTQSWGAYTLITQMPMFLSDTFNVRLSSVGIFSCLPYIVNGLLGTPCGILVDKMEEKACLSKLNIRRLFVCTGFLLQCAFMLITIHLKDTTLIILSLITAIGSSSISSAGFFPNFLDIAPQFSMILLGLSNTFATASGIGSPILTGFIVRNKSVEEWTYVFYIAAAVFLFGTITYFFTGSIEVQPWAKGTNTSETNTENQENTNQNEKIKRQLHV